MHAVILVKKAYMVFNKLNNFKCIRSNSLLKFFKGFLTSLIISNSLIKLSFRFLAISKPKLLACMAVENEEISFNMPKANHTRKLYCKYWQSFRNFFSIEKLLYKHGEACHTTDAYCRQPISALVPVMCPSQFCRVRDMRPSSQSRLKFCQVRVESWLGRIESESSHKNGRVTSSHWVTSSIQCRVMQISNFSYIFLAISPPWTCNGYRSASWLSVAIGPPVDLQWL